MDGTHNAKNFVDVGALEDIPPRGARTVKTTLATSPCSAPPMTRSSPCATNARTSRGR